MSVATLDGKGIQDVQGSSFSRIYAILGPKLHQQAITEMPGLSLQGVHFLDILLTHCTY